MQVLQRWHIFWQCPVRWPTFHQEAYSLFCVYHKIIVLWYCSKVMSHLLTFYSWVTCSTWGKQRVAEIANQANTWFRLLAKSGFPHTVVPSQCCNLCCEYTYTHQKIQYSTSTIQVMYILQRVLEKAGRFIKARLSCLWAHISQS